MNTFAPFLNDSIFWQAAFKSQILLYRKVFVETRSVIIFLSSFSQAGIFLQEGFSP